MIELIKPYYENEDIQRLNLHTDISNWKSEVAFLEQENQFYKKFFSSALIGKTAVNRKEVDSLSRELQTLDSKNQAFLDKLRGFQIELEGIKECEDMQCETYFLNNHQKFKIEIETYFFENRKLKAIMYSSLEKQLHL